MFPVYARSVFLSPVLRDPQSPQFFSLPAPSAPEPNNQATRTRITCYRKCGLSGDLKAGLRNGVLDDRFCRESLIHLWMTVRAWSRAPSRIDTAGSTGPKSISPVVYLDQCFPTRQSTFLLSPTSKRLCRPFGVLDWLGGCENVDWLAIPQGLGWETLIEIIIGWRLRVAQLTRTSFNELEMTERSHLGNRGSKVYRNVPLRKKAIQVWVRKAMCLNYSAVRVRMPPLGWSQCRT